MYSTSLERLFVTGGVKEPEPAEAEEVQEHKQEYKKPANLSEVHAPLFW